MAGRHSMICVTNFVVVGVKKFKARMKPLRKRHLKLFFFF
jgi:hypothetical protein